MKNVDHVLDILLLKARPIESNQHSSFTNNVMRQLAHAETFAQNTRIKDRQSKWSSIMHFTTLHRATAVIVAAIILAAVSFTGYAYAIGSNPVSLLRRWVSGDSVKVEYEGRTFQHGKQLSYSDAAITAFAELHTVEALHFQASNAFQIPKDGLEHVSDPYYTQYTYPWIGTVERVDDTTAFVRRQYIPGDKVVRARDTNELISLPIQRILYYTTGETAHLAPTQVGKLVQVFEDGYLEHRINAKIPPQSIRQYFVFQLTHSLDNIKESNSNDKGADEATTPLYEPSWGGLSDICLNNGADKCETDKQGSRKGINLYVWPGAGSGSNTQIPGNPTAVPLGERAADASQVPADLLLRNTQGSITAITATHLVIKSSSATRWTLAYTADQQASFAQRTGRPLKIGDTLFVSVIASANDLDNRQFDEHHIDSMERY